MGARLTGGRWRTLPQRLTDEYLSLCAYGVRYYHPGVPVLGILPPPHRAPLYGGVTAAHPAAVAAARAWGRREGVPMVDVSAIAARHLAGRAVQPGRHALGLGLPRGGRAGGGGGGGSGVARARYD